VFGGEGADYAAEDHVDCCCDEGGCAEDEHFLEGPGFDFGSGFVGPCSAVVAECFAWLGDWVSQDLVG
jgi:hypothetical protein